MEDMYKFSQINTFQVKKRFVIAINNKYVIIIRSNIQYASHSYWSNE